MFRKALGAVAVGALLTTVAACTASSDGSAQGTGADLTAVHVSPSATPVLTSTAEVSLPIEDYLLRNDEHAEILQASRIVVRRCMARFGFDYTVDPDPAAPPDPKGDAANMARRYGISDEATAARYGYHPADGSLPAAPTGTAQPMSSAERSVFLGGTARYKGQRIPAHGCSGDAQRKLGKGLDERLPERIDDASYQQSMAAPQVAAVFRAWSACMAQRGYTFRDPLEPLRSQPAASPTATEIRTAEADMACKRRTNLLGVWVAVESAVQDALIEKNQEALAQTRTAARDTLARSAKVVAEGVS